MVTCRNRARKVDGQAASHRTGIQGQAPPPTICIHWKSASILRWQTSLPAIPSGNPSRSDSMILRRLLRHPSTLSNLSPLRSTFAPSKTTHVVPYIFLALTSALFIPNLTDGYLWPEIKIERKCREQNWLIEREKDYSVSHWGLVSNPSKILF